MLIREVIESAAKQLQALNIERSQNEARLLLAHLLHWSPEQIIQRDDESISERDFEQFQKLLQRRLQFEPIAYILGLKEFFGLKFEVSKDVLIPRPETESLVEKTLEWIKETEINSGKILELGTGSGCISIALASRLGKNFEFTALDISEAALRIAQKNADQNSIPNISFKKGDIQAKPFGSWDIIVSNPPYIPEKEMKTLQKDILHFEPHIALVAGEDGLQFLSFIVLNWSKHLKSPGLLALETFGPDQVARLGEIAQNKFSHLKTEIYGPHFFLET